MRLRARGRRTSNAEVPGVLREGVWVLVRGQEYFLPFDRYPWFKQARIADIQHVELLHGHHLHWPKLDVDLTGDSLTHPERYPLTSR